jgi:hypothetical protein
VKKRIPYLLIAAMLALSSGPIVACGRTGNAGVSSAPTEKVEVQALVRVDYPGFRQALDTGQKVKFRDTGSTIGEIASVTETSALLGVATWDGSLVLTSSPNLRDVSVTIVGQARLTDSGYTFEGTHLYVNQTAKLLAPYAQFDPVILSIKKLGG